MNRPTLVVLLLVAAARTAAAQDSTAKPEPSCFRGRPLPACRNYWITEAAYGFRVVSANRGGSYARGASVLPTVAVGGMRNLSARMAVGATLETGVLGDLYLAAKPRLRYWLSPETALDLSPGVVLTRGNDMPRVAADVSIMFQDRVGITAQSFLVPATEYRAGAPPITRKRLMTTLGIRFGSKLGVAGAVADVAAFLAVVGIYLVSCGTTCD